MSPLGCQKMSAKPCNRNAEESFPVLSLKSREQKPPNPLLIQDKDVLQPSLGLRLMLSEFSPIPGTPDGERCREWVDLDEPLWHNKTVFPLVLLGAEEVQRLKALCRELNGTLGSNCRPKD